MKTAYYAPDVRGRLVDMLKLYPEDTIDGSIVTASELGILEVMRNGAAICLSKEDDTHKPHHVAFVNGGVVAVAAFQLAELDGGVVAETINAVSTKPIPSDFEVNCHGWSPTANAAIESTLGAYPDLGRLLDAMKSFYEKEDLEDLLSAARLGMGFGTNLLHHALDGVMDNKIK